MRFSRSLTTVMALVLALSAGYADPVHAAGTGASASSDSSASSAVPPIASGSGSNFGVTVDDVIIGRRLHLQHWPVASSAHVQMRIDIWVAPNAAAAYVVSLKSEGVGLRRCSSLILQRGRVNRISCLLVVPDVVGSATGHVRLEVHAGTHRYRHSFVVLMG